MEMITVEVNASRFDQAVHNGLPEGNDICIYIKKDATVDGAAAAVITFSVKLPDGTIARAQAATTAKLLINVGKSVEALTKE